MKRDAYEEARKQSEEIASLLKEGTLDADERKKFETLQAQLAGVLLHPWLPVGWTRRLAMLVLFMIGVYGLVVGSHLFLLAWVFVLLFSPRFSGEFLRLVGMFLRG